MKNSPQLIIIKQSLMINTAYFYQSRLKWNHVKDFANLHIGSMMTGHKYDLLRWVISKFDINFCINFKCTKTCGGGTQRRSAKCMDKTNQVISDAQCNENEKVIEQVCNNQKCPVWSFDDWTPVIYIFLNFNF